MKKLFCTTSLIVILLLGFTACSNDSMPKLPNPPNQEEVLRDVEGLITNVLLGDSPERLEYFPLSTLVIDEAEIQLTQDKETINAEITAYVGDTQWKSDVKKVITVHYELNASRHWEVRGANVNDPVVRVIQRTQIGL